jgi:hypothetical protein
MADIGVQYYLDTPTTDITFNDDSDDQVYIVNIGGLGMPQLRTPIDNVPFGDGGLVHDFWEGPRHLIIDGLFLITSTAVMDDIVVIRNDFEDDLITALTSIERADGTLTWTPQGQSQRQLTVRCDVPVDFAHDANWTVETFAFGLVAANPDW